jgi:hypothetical protein
MPWVYVKDYDNFSGITTAAFNFGYQNKGGGVYWVNYPLNRWLYCTATGYNSVNKWTDNYGTSISLYLTRSK